MDLTKIYTDNDFENAVVPEGQILVFTGLENGKVVTRYKDSSGNFGTIAGNGGGNNSGSSVEFYKCTEVFGPKTVTFLTVTGAGTDDCNGRYDEDGAKNGAPLYKRTSSSGTIWYIYFITSEMEENGWVLSDNQDTYLWGGHYYANSLSGTWYMGEAGASEPAPTVVTGSETLNADQPKVWSGRLAAWKNGEHTYAEDITSGLVYGDGYSPEVGEVYDSSAIVKASLWNGAVLVKMPFEDGTASDTSQEGHSVTNEGGSAVSVDGRQAWNFDGGYLKIAPKGDEFVFDGDFTIKADIYPTSEERQCIFAYERDSVFAVAYSYGGDRRLSLFVAGSWYSTPISDPLPLNVWHEIVIQKKNGAIFCFVNKMMMPYSVTSTRSIGNSGQYVSFGRWGNDAGDFSSHWRGYMDNIEIHNAALY